MDLQTRIRQLYGCTDKVFGAEFYQAFDEFRFALNTDLVHAGITLRPRGLFPGITQVILAS
jgi:hypothetical protein